MPGRLSTWPACGSAGATGNAAAAWIGDAIPADERAPPPQKIRASDRVAHRERKTQEADVQAGQRRAIPDGRGEWSGAAPNDLREADPHGLPLHGGMMGKTSIEWTDRSWNPVVGCSRVSPGCVNCYAERLAGTRLRESEAYNGLTAIRPGRLIGDGSHATAEPRWTGDVRLLPDRLDEPLRWRKPRRIFVCDMGDLFHESVPDDYIDRVLGVTTFAPRHTFQILTKRAERMRGYFAGDRWAKIEVAARTYHRDTCSACQRADDCGRARPHMKGVTLPEFPWPHLWLGVSVEDQKRADERIPLLLQTPAAVRFLSVEPMLERIDLHRGLLPQSIAGIWADPPMDSPDHRTVDWVIFGGESGPGARPCHVEWIRDGLRQCREAGVAAFVKQLGAFSVWGGSGLIANNPTCQVSKTIVAGAETFRLITADRKGGDMSEWPEDLRVREFPNA